MTAVWIAAGALAGWAQAVLLLRQARRGLAGPTLLLRLALVGVVLVPAALAGHILGATVGWLLGHLVSVLVLARRLP